MFKKLLKLVTVFVLLLGCYHAYVRAFDLVVKRLTSARRIDDMAFKVRDSRSKKEAIERAREAFGPDHWTAHEDLQLRYYNSERGFWMYSQKEERVLEEDGVRYDGRRIKLRPAAIIWRARDGSSTKTVIADEAVIDFNQPLTFNAKPGSDPLVVKYARLERNVLIRDDRGTPPDRRDDLVIGPLTWVEYDDNSLQVRSDSRVEIVDRDTVITGDGLLIQLRPKSEPQPNTPRSAGFEGAQSARLNGNVEVRFSDVGKTGVLPGGPPSQRAGSGKVDAVVTVDPTKTSRPNAAAAQPVPLNLRCDGPMLAEFPKPKLPVKVGPPDPPTPTLVHFERNVVVRRGKLTELPDQLDTDNLDLVLVPTEKVAKRADPQAPKPDAGTGQAANDPATAQAANSKAGQSSGSLGNLTIQRVKASGHAVWLQLPAQGAKIRCNELIHKIGPPGTENLTYFWGDATRKVMVEKHDFVDDGLIVDGKATRRKLQSITRVWTIDATLVDNGSGMEASNLFAHGPGLLETRPAPQPTDPPGKDIPPERTVAWQDILILKNVMGADKRIVGRELILKGHPRVVDRVREASLDAAESIVVWLKPKPRDEGTQPTGAQGENFQIERLLALRDVHLIAPRKKMNARDRLDVDFEQAASPAPAVASNTATAAAPAATTNAPAAVPNETQAAPTPETVEPAMFAAANHVKAKVRLDLSSSKMTTSNAPSDTPKPTAESNAADQIRDLQMFGNVSLHQDAAPGKTKGQDATGEALVLLNQGPGRAIFNLYNHDPRAQKPQNAANAKRPPAKVVTEDMSVEGNVIGVNQMTDQAWVYGPGKMVRLTDRGLLTDRIDLNGEEPRDSKTVVTRARTRAGKALSSKVPLTITWGERMVFSGRAQDPQGHPSAKAQFFKNVVAKLEDDGVLNCSDVMTTYTDKPIPLAEVGKLSKAGASGAQAPIQDNAEDVQEPSPELTIIDMVGKAQVISRKVDPERPIVMSRQRITGDRLIYDRRAGDFEIPGAGEVFLYEREGNSASSTNPSRLGPMAGGRPIRPTSGRAVNRGEDSKLPVPNLVLTQIRFSKEMKGRVGTGKANDKNEPRWADFFGDIEAARAVVPNERTIINFDRRPAGSYFLTSQTLRVVTEQPPPGSPENAPARNYLKAWENAYASTDEVALRADTITYDSEKDLIYANGHEGRSVQIVKQNGVGQQSSPTKALSLRVNPRTGAVDLSDPRELQIVDAKTGTRPKPQAPPDPNAKAPSRSRMPYKVAPNNLERKGYTGR